MNNNFTTNNSLYHLQKGLDGISILKDPLKRTDEGLGCKERAYIWRRTPQKRGDGHFRRKKGTNERTKKYPAKQHHPYL